MTTTGHITHTCVNTGKNISQVYKELLIELHKSTSQGNNDLEKAFFNALLKHPVSQSQELTTVQKEI